MMETERLYFLDPYATEFSAHVVARREHKGKQHVALDQSAFYPEGGGQPADTGMLNGVAVVDVQVEAGLVWHALATPLEADHVHGVVDWQRRFDHMQQHLGQHLLSAAFEQVCERKTISFHLGVAVVTIDLDGSIDAKQVAATEALVNQVIWEDRPVLARFVSPQELATLSLRKPPTVAGPVRVVSIADFDHSACGGTHPHSTGGLGLVHVRRWERRGEVMRVEFVCGGRALRDYQTRDAMVSELAASMSIAPDELSTAVARLRESEEQSRKRLQAATSALIDYEAAALAVEASDGVVSRAFANRPIEEVRALAGVLARLGNVALLGTASDRAQLVFASPAGSVDCGALLRQVLALFEGRGGGQATLAQGGLPDPMKLAAALQAAEQHARHMLQ